MLHISPIKSFFPSFFHDLYVDDDMCLQSSKAIDKASENPEVVQVIGVPIARGPWYDASVVLGHRRRSVACTFPVTGPRGSGVFQIEAVRNGGLSTATSFLTLIHR